MKKSLASLKARVALAALVALCAAAVAQADMCWQYPHSQKHFDWEFGAWCAGASNFHCTVCWNQDTGASCSTFYNQCNPIPFNQNPNP